MRAKINHTRALSKSLDGSPTKHTSLYLSETAADYIRDQAAARGMSQSLFLDILLLEYIKMTKPFPTAKEVFNKRV